CLASGQEGTCLCQAANGKGATCSSGGTCCLQTCAPCESKGECCGGGSLDCDVFNHRCCGAGSGSERLGGPCSGKAGCCSNATCTQNGPCQLCASGQSMCNGTFSCSQGGGCIALGDACSASSGLACCGDTACVSGHCQIPIPTSVTYHLLSYPFNDYTSIPMGNVAPSFDATNFSGTPVAVTAVKDAIVATTGPDQLLGFSYLVTPANSVSLAFTIATPHPFNVFATVPLGFAGMASTFDALVGEPTLATYYEVVNGAVSQQNPTAPAAVDGNAVAVSESSNFDVTSQKDATVGTDTGKLYHFEFAHTPPLQEGFVDLSNVNNTNLGVPASIDTASMDTWVVTLGSPSNMFLHRGVPSLDPITTTKFGPTLGNPVAVRGAKTWMQGYPYIVVAFAPPGGSTQGQINAYNGGDTADMVPVINSFSGSPVAMAVTTDGSIQYAWVATTAPNRVYVFKVNQVAMPIATLLLPGEPIDLTVGLNPNSKVTGLQTGMLHVAVRVP